MHGPFYGTLNQWKRWEPARAILKHRDRNRSLPLVPSSAVAVAIGLLAGLSPIITFGAGCPFWRLSTSIW
jgi:hypothetical protein